MKEKLVLKTGDLGNLESIANALWMDMTREIQVHGYSNLTLNLEGAVHGIREIIKLNNITEG